MELCFACVVVLFVALASFTLGMKNYFEKKLDTMCKSMAAISLSKAKEDEKINELFKRICTLTADVNGNVELVNKLVHDLEELQEYMEDRKTLDQREERMLSGINNIMNYDIGVARKAVEDGAEEREG